MSKNFTKIFILFSFISLISCSYLNEAKTKYSTKPASSTPRVKLIAPQDLTHNQFESRNLNTAQENKEKTKIALFFPISGKNSDLGMHLFNAAVLSLFENDTNHDIELILIDSKDTPQESLAAFQTIIDRKIKIVIGPIYSSAIDAIKERAKTNEITILSLSNNHQLAGNINDKGGVFLSGFTIETQLDKIVSFSMKKNRTNFAILAPNNQYGHTVTNILKTIVDNRDGNFTASEVYDSNLKRLEKSVERIVNSFAVPSELAEGGGNKLRKDFKASEVVRSYVQVIVVPETGKNLSKIAELIKKYNIEERDIKIVGTSEWDSLSTLNDPNLIGSYFAAPDAGNFHEFEKRYNTLYGNFPPRIASISYDLVAATAKLMQQKKTGDLKPSDFTSYENPPINGFSGIDGLFRFLPNGLVQRNLAILEVKEDGFETVGKANSKLLRY